MIYSRNTEEFLNKREFSYSMPKDLFSKLTGSIDGGVLCIGENILAWEFKREDIWAGIIIEDFDKESKFESWFFHLLLSTSSVNYNMASEESFEKYTDKIANKFVEELKNTTLGDQWDATGEEHFKGVVNFFTSRGAPIEAVLPAFPCKSSNMMKVASQLPDLGEALSLKRLVSFAESIKKVYPPGMKIWIVSDGHVFSDCSMFEFFATA